MFESIQGKYDLIISNPPYISEEELKISDKEITDFEPRYALVGGKVGIEYYQNILQSAGHYISEQGKIFFEIGSGQSRAIQQIAQDSKFRVISIFKDYNNRDRVVLLEMS